MQSSTFETSYNAFVAFSANFSIARLIGPVLLSVIPRYLKFVTFLENNYKNVLKVLYLKYIFTLLYTNILTTIPLYNAN